MSRLQEAFRERLYPTEFKGALPVKEIIVAGDLGPCGGVNMAILGMDMVLSMVEDREPVYINNKPVHNDLILKEFKKRGLIVEPDITKVPDRAIWVSSAHGLDVNQFELAREKSCQIVNLECQLVGKVKRAAIRAQEKGEHLVYAGVTNHPESNAVLSTVDKTSTTLIDNTTELSQLILPKGPIRVLNQTTLSSKGIKDRIQKLRKLNPGLIIPDPMGICPATDVRQNAINGIFSAAHKPDFLLVVGSKESHNSEELRLIGENYLDADHAKMIDKVEDINPTWFAGGINRLAFTAGASVLDKYSIDVLEYFQDRGVRISFRAGKEKDQIFTLPASDLAGLQEFLTNKYAA